MIIVEGFVQLEPGEINWFRRAAVEMLRETRNEAGCLTYAFATDLDDPETVRIVERDPFQVVHDMRAPRAREHARLLSVQR